MAALLLVGVGAASGSHESHGSRAGMPRLWAVQVAGGKAGWFDRSLLRQVRADGINTLVLRISSLPAKAAGRRTFDAVRRFAAAERLYVVAVVRPGKPHSRAARRAVGTCSSRRYPRLRCAVQAPSVAAAVNAAKKRSPRNPLVAVYVRGPRKVSALSRAPRTLRRHIIVIVPLHRSFDASAWGSAIAQASAKPSVDLGVAPLTSGASSALRQFAALLAERGAAAGNPPPPPPTPPPPPSSPPPPPAAANLWVDAGGGSCSRSATPTLYADASACGSFQAAYSAAQCGDVVGVAPGSYPSQTISAGTKSCSPGTQVAFTSAPGAICADNSLVSMPSFSISVAYLKLGCMSANPPGTTDCEDISGASHTSVVWITLDQVAMHCAFFDSDHLRVTRSTFGPDDTCQTNMEDLIDFRANSTSIDDVVFDHDTFETVTAPPDFECGAGEHVDSIQGYGISNLVIADSIFYGCPGQCLILRPYAGGTPGPVTIVNSIFNEPQSPGQAIDIGSDSAADGDHCKGPIMVENDTFVNGASVHGGCWNGPSVTFRNNIMTSGSCGFGGGASYADNVFYSGGPCGSSAKACSPHYVAGTSSLTSAGNFHLAAGDTCARGAATKTAGDYPATDIDGQPRPQGPGVDAGADEIP